MTDPLVTDSTLFALDEPECMFEYERAPNASKARYLGWRILSGVGYVQTPFDPRFTRALVRYMRRFTDDPFAELTHSFCDRGDADAVKVWHVVVEEDV